MKTDREHPENRRPGRIAVFLGGLSTEREVSLRSGAAVSAALKRLNYEVIERDARPGCVVEMPAVDLVFLALHGAYGEDGQVQRELESAGLPYTGCDAGASQRAFDKGATLRALREAKIPVARSEVLGWNGTLGAPEWPIHWEPPVVLKPVLQGSSVGLQFVHGKEEWPQAIRAAMAFGCDVLMEEWVDGRELTVAILDGKALPIVEIQPERGPYDYQNKYTAGATRYTCPADLPLRITGRVQQVALHAFECLGGRDYGRVDILLRADGSPVVLEVNTLPGMTETSLFPKAALAAGWTFDELCERMVLMAWERFQRQSAMTREFSPATVKSEKATISAQEERA